MNPAFSIEIAIVAAYYKSKVLEYGDFKVARGRFSPIFAFSAHPSAELDLRVHNVGLDASQGDGCRVGSSPGTFAEGIGTKACLGRLAQQRLLLNCSAVLPESTNFRNLPTAHQTCAEDV